MVNNTLELRKDIQRILLQAHGTVVYLNADKDTKYPYVVYSIKDIFGSKILNIDIWNRDVEKSTRVIENLADSIEKMLDRYILNNENHSFTIFYNEDRKWVDDEDKFIQRINESFEIRYYGKE